MHGGAILCPSYHRCRTHPLLMCDIDFLFVTGGWGSVQRTTTFHTLLLYIIIRKSNSAHRHSVRTSMADLFCWHDKNSQWNGDGPGSSVITVTKLCAGWMTNMDYTGLFISSSGISELDCATTKTDTAERSISIGRESLQVFFVLWALAYF